jgi:hypothetical protein
MTTPLPNDYYDRKARNLKAPRTPANTSRRAHGFLSYDGNLVEGRRKILAAVIHATGAGLKLHNINMIEDADKATGNFRYTVEGDQTAIGIFTDALNSI